jgi:hypothetical protein
MGQHLKWYDSPHWTKKIETPHPEPAIVEELTTTMELPPLTSPRTRHEIIDAIRDDPRYNAINPSNQQHIIDMAIVEARNNGTLIEETEGELVNG